MLAVSILLLCIHALLIQNISAACWGNAVNSAWSGWGEGLGWGGPGLPADVPVIETGAAPSAARAPFLGAGWATYGPGAVAASNGGGFAVSSASPIAPVGVSVASDNAIEGILGVGGEIPFIGTVGLESAMPTAGAGTVTYGCGNGAVGMVTEDIAPMAMGFPFAAPGLGYGPGWNGAYGWAGTGSRPFGCGCGRTIEISI
ncbi:unnamed protein product, partial [Iphiclides podalirius]